jgi:hypothetical protein
MKFEIYRDSRILMGYWLSIFAEVFAGSELVTLPDGRGSVRSRAATVRERPCANTFAKINIEEARRHQPPPWIVFNKK